MLYVHDNATRRFGRLVHCAGALLTLGSAIAGYLLFYAPKMQATEATNRTIAALELSLQRAPAIQREHAQLSSRLRAMEERVEAIHHRVPREARDSEFLSSLTTLAVEVGLDITDLTPSSPVQKSGYSQMDIVLTGRSTYESLCRFVDGIGRFPRLAKILGLDVRHDPTGEGVYPVTVKVAIFFNAHGPRTEEERR
jgi:Tfp pilus assembly protein PilO